MIYYEFNIYFIRYIIISYSKLKLLLFVHFFQGIENQIKVLLLFLKIVKGFLILSIKCFSQFQRLSLKILNLTMCGSRFVEGWNLDVRL